MDYHDLQTSKLIEVRAVPRSDVTDAEIFYVVHRVFIGNAAWYHHGIVIADSLDTVGAGLNKLEGNILSEIGNAKASVTPVFLRNLMALDEDVIDSAKRKDIADEIRVLRSSGQAECFVVFGIVGDEHLTLTNIVASNAYTAVKEVADCVMEQFNKPFLPLDASLAQPVADELEIYFKQAATSIKAMLVTSHITVH